MDNLLEKIALTCTPLVGAVTARQLIAYSGGVKEVFEARRSELARIPGVGEKVIENILEKKGFALAEQELVFIERNAVKAIFYLDEAYPRRLRHYNDAPILLYYRGTADLNSLRTVGIVGTRKPSAQGIMTCETLVADLQIYQPTVISGLAYGIDVVAHRKCLEHNIPTIGVLGHGLGRIYPAAHHQVAERMLTRGGLLTEYPSWVGPDREHFPMRNRIVAGLSDALVVVETARKGGSVITAKYANEYNKNVFAVPGRIQDRMAVGCNYLIKSHQANLLDHASDVAYHCQWDKRDAHQHQLQIDLFADLTPAEQTIVDLLEEKDILGVDQLGFAAQMNNGILSSTLLSLEFNGLVKELPGKRYTLVR